jgi:hypothetical protein
MLFSVTGGSSIAGASGELGLSCDDDRLDFSLVGVDMSPRREEVEDLRNNAGDEDRLSDCRLRELDALRSCGFGDGRGVEIVRL